MCVFVSKVELVSYLFKMHMVAGKSFIVLARSVRHTAMGYGRSCVLGVTISTVSTDINMGII